MTLNYAEMIRECVHWTSKAPKASARYLYWISDKRPKLSSAIPINQARLNYVKPQQTKSNIIPRQVSCNRQTSKITILYEHLKRQFSRIFQNPTLNTQDARSWKRPQCPQVQKANQLIEQQMQIYIYSRRKKVRRITCKLTSISRRHGIFILIQSIIYF